jgi:putative peptidoglycan lipid II flippase
VRIVRAIATVGGLTGVSRVFGLIRESLMSHILGVSALTDAFLVAFKFPNFFRRFFAEGAFNAAFVPLFSQKLAVEGREQAHKTAEQVFSILASALIGLVLLVVIFTPWIIHAMAPGFATTPDRLEMAVTFTRITFPYILFISLAALLSGVLNSFDRFAAAAAAPILLNIVMILALLSYLSSETISGNTLAWAVFLAGILQFSWLYLSCRRLGFIIRFRLPRLTPEVKKVMKLMIPGAIGAGVMNINLFIDMILASLLPQGSITYLYYADRLNQLPLSIFGIAIGTALLPSLSRQIRMEEFDRAHRSQNLALELALQLTLPAAVGLILLSYPIISLLYGLDQQDTQHTAFALSAFALGIPAYVLTKVFSTSFFARQDTTTPVKIAIGAIIVNFILNLILMRYFAHVGMALATSCSAWLNALCLCLILLHRGWIKVAPSLSSLIFKLCFVCALMGIGIWYLEQNLASLFALKTLGQVSHLFILIFSGALLFVVLGHIFGALNLGQIRQLLKRTS